MSIYVVVSSYFYNLIFGSYSTVKRARIAFEDFLKNDENITSFEDVGDYRYIFITVNGEQFGAEIFNDEIDYEFTNNFLKEDE